MYRVKRPLLWLLVTTVIGACGDSHRTATEPGPVDPEPPIIFSIEPDRARPGDRITIHGEHFGSRADDVTVTVAGRHATPLSFADTVITVFVPSAEPGPSQVIVGVQDRLSEAAAFTVLQRLPPLILDVIPNPVRAALPLAIKAENFDHTDVQVLLDEAHLEADSVADSTVIASMPVELNLGRHSVILQSGGDRSNKFEFSVDDFDMTGTYDLRATVTVRDTSSICELIFGPGWPPSLGSVRTVRIVVSDARPSLRIAVTGFSEPFSGIVTSEGQFTAARRLPNTSLPDLVLNRISGLATRRTVGPGQGTIDIAATIFTSGFPCPGSYTETAVGTRQ